MCVNIYLFISVSIKYKFYEGNGSQFIERFIIVLSKSELSHNYVNLAVEKNSEYTSTLYSALLTIIFGPFYNNISKTDKNAKGT